MISRLRTPLSTGSSPPIDAAELITGLRGARPAEALGMAYDLFHRRVRVLARRLLADEAVAEDVVQEVFAGLPAAVRRFRGTCDLPTFLCAIAVKRARHQLRVVIRRRRAIERLDRDSAEARSDLEQPDRVAYRRQLADRLVRALDRIPGAQRVAFVLCHVEGMAGAEAAEIAGVPEATIRTRCFHARRRLQGLLWREREE